MSDSNRVNLLYDRESTYGVAPTGSGIYTAFRPTSIGFSQDTTTTTSQEIRSDRQIADLIRTGIQAQGELGFELSYGAFDQFLESALYSGAFSSESLDAVSDAVTFESKATASGNYPKILRTVGSFITDGFTVGDIVRIQGANTAANNGFVKVVSVAALELEVKWVDFTDDASATVTTLDIAAQIVNGTTQTSYTFEAEYQDNTNDFAVWTGMVLDTLGLTITPEAIIAGTMGFIGKAEASGSSSLESGTAIAAASNEVMNAIDNVAAIIEGAYGTAGDLGTEVDAVEVGFNIANNLAPRLQIGTLGAVSIRAGTFQTTGTFRGYYEDSTILDKYLGFDNTALALRTVDNAGNLIFFDWPKTKFSAGARTAPGINEDVFEDMSWEAVRDPTEDITMRVATLSAP